jgi:hypothetical protein
MMIVYRCQLGDIRRGGNTSPAITRHKIESKIKAVIFSHFDHFSVFVRFTFFFLLLDLLLDFELFALLPLFALLLLLSPPGLEEFFSAGSITLSKA